jgi:hypothetical protein
MKRFVVLLGIIGVVLFLMAPAAVVAQEGTADDYVEVYKPLVGTWKTVTSRVLPKRSVSPGTRCGKVKE